MVAAAKTDAKVREEIFTVLYENAFPLVATFVSQRRGTLEDAKDIFHDALIIFYEKMRGPKMTITVSAEAYIVGIAKHLWIRKYKQDSASVAFDAVEAAIEMPEDTH